MFLRFLCILYVQNDCITWVVCFNLHCALWNRPVCMRLDFWNITKDVRVFTVFTVRTAKEVKHL
jgi:hypothetical protein